MVLLETEHAWTLSSGKNYDLKLNCGTLTYNKHTGDYIFQFYENKDGRVDFSKDPMPTGVMFLSESGSRQDFGNVVWNIIQHHYKDIKSAESSNEIMKRDLESMLKAVEKSLKIK